MTHEDYKELLAAQALTALDAAEAGALAVHLESCADCRLELSEWEATTALLALDAGPLEPPAPLRASILASVSEDREPRATDTPASVRAPASESKVLAFGRPPKSVWASLGAVGAIAATLVCAVSLVLLLVLWQENRAMQRNWLA